MLAYEFMRHALAAAAIVALVCGAAGYVLVLRRQAFAGHALGHVGFAGAAGAMLIGAAPIWGLLAVTVSGGALMGLAGERLGERDVATGMVLSTALGFGVLFLGLLTTASAPATSLLFGNVLGVDTPTLWRMAAVAAVIFAGLAAISRQLLFATIRPELAEAQGIKPRLISALFLALVGLAVAEATQVVGVLLVFTLLVGPAAAAQRLTATIRGGVALSIALAAIQALGGVCLAYVTDWPATFWITALSAVCFIGASVR